MNMIVAQLGETPSLSIGNKVAEGNHFEQSRAALAGHGQPGMKSSSSQSSGAG